MSKDIPALLEEAAERGFVKNFEIRETALFCRETKRSYIDRAIRTVDIIQKDAGTDPGDEATLFLLEAEDGERGILLIGNPASLSAEERAILDSLQS
ncbi:hypothetical protein GCM10007853_30500 [Algimonas ampicilliniresistens]|uniref:Phosphoribosylpyrophosphate synthetase n=1 Tax=Algimonas ampicilliniresistens TaxID=1298735 RepID=A0ABQ5VF02_9PROT|nr:hypothetical protein [Algimonas ampicilliniresistens]GLQ25176.1 hypothetical protein GCM10007853_30500 [Algimonas ampicilliniresistens]